MKGINKNQKNVFPFSGSITSSNSSTGSTCQDKLREEEPHTNRVSGGLVFMLFGLVFLLSSCMFEELDKPNPKPPGSEKMVAVNFTLGGLIDNDSVVVTRSADEHWKEAGGIANASEQEATLHENVEEALFAGDSEDAETVVVPIGNGLSMVATLEVDQRVKMRTTTSGFPKPMLIRIVAYTDGNTYYKHHEFYIDQNDNLVPYDENGFIIPAGKYKFVAYAYANNTYSIPFPYSDIHYYTNPDNDLIWGCYPNDGSTVNVSESTNNISITMEHKFSGVNIVLSTDQISGSKPIFDPNWSIGNVFISGVRAHLKVADGTFVPNNDNVDYQFNGDFTNNGNYEVSTSGTPFLVHTGGSPTTTLKIESLTLFFDYRDGITYPDLSAVFYKQLKGGVIYTLKVNFVKDDGVIYDNKPPSNVMMYVGAFWKSHQTGERLITIKRPTDGQLDAIDGAWEAKVIAGNAWIVLDTQPSADQYNIAMNVPLKSGNDNEFDTDYPVNSIARTVTGYIDQNTPQIYFRIGLTSPYYGTSDNPSRYGLVQLTYKNNTMKHRIWIRQGHEPDYLIAYGSPESLTSGHTSGFHRYEAIKLSPYNLTADAFDQPVVSQADYYNASVIGPRSRFTDYPTQAGAHFQWASSGQMRYAWNPYSSAIPNPPSSATWVQGVESNFWNSLQANHEVCPPGYRRVNDGFSDKADDGSNITQSELRQSLFEDLTTGFVYDPNLSNSVFGYYADGFFDRRQIVDVGRGRPTTVANGTKDIAHAGRLFYNPFTGFEHAGSSLFFPLGGTRSQNAGAIGNLGGEAGYWTSSRLTSGGNVHMLRLRELPTPVIIEPEATSGNFGFLIRCVK